MDPFDLFIWDVLLSNTDHIVSHTTMWVPTVGELQSMWSSFVFQNIYFHYKTLLLYIYHGSTCHISAPSWHVCTFHIQYFIMFWGSLLCLYVCVHSHVHTCLLLFGFFLNYNCVPLDPKPIQSSTQIVFKSIKLIFKFAIKCDNKWGHHVCGFWIYTVNGFQSQHNGRSK